MKQTPNKETKSTRRRASALRPFALPVLYAVTLAGLAPVIREFSNALRRWLGGDFGLVLGGLMAVVGMAIMLGALLRIRQRRAFRYAMVAAAIAMVLTPILTSDRGSPAEAAVERLHYLLFGLMALLFYRAFHQVGFGRASALLALLAVSLGGLLDESVQWASAVRTGEMFDVGLNVYSGLCGVVLSVGLITPVPRSIDRRTTTRTLAALLVGLVLGLACFIEQVHLGYRIVDPEIGSFKSLFSEQQLEEINRRRSARWSRTPPSYPPRPSELEDHFWTEAGDRVRQRNEAVHAEQPQAAFKENQILERYYWAFLELKAGDGRDFRYRLSDARIDTLRELQSTPAGDYQSDALSRVWLRPSSRSLWSVVAAIVLPALAWGWRPRASEVT